MTTVVRHGQPFGRELQTDREPGRVESVGVAHRVGQSCEHLTEVPPGRSLGRVADPDGERVSHPGEGRRTLGRPGDRAQRRCKVRPRGPAGVTDPLGDRTDGLLGAPHGLLVVGSVLPVLAPVQTVQGGAMVVQHRGRGTQRLEEADWIQLFAGDHRTRH